MKNKNNKYFILVTPELNVPSYLYSCGNSILTDVIKLPIWIKWVSYLDVIFTRQLSDDKFYHNGILFNSIEISIIEKNEIYRIVNEDLPEKLATILHDLGLCIVSNSFQHSIEYDNLVLENEKLTKQVKDHYEHILQLSEKLISSEEKIKEQVEYIENISNDLSLLESSYNEFKLSSSEILDKLNKKFEYFISYFNYNDMVGYISKLSNIAESFINGAYYGHKSISKDLYEEFVNIINKLKKLMDTD